jgi:hypothetical protein
MRGIAGYMADLATELARLNNAFRGGIVSLPGIPILLGGCRDRTAIRAITEAGRWFTHSGSFHLQETMKMVMSGIAEMGEGGVWETEKMRHPMPLNLSGITEQRSWVSGGWTTPCEVQPFTPELEEKIVRSLACELNGLFNLGLGTEPICDRLSKDEKRVAKILVIGGSHSIREAEELAKRGYDVVSCGVSGWRPNMTAIQDMTDKVTEAVKDMTDGDIVLIHCFDNVAYMARSEEGGDLPIRRYPDGSYHIEGDLVLSSKERLFMFFKNCIPIFKLLEKFLVFFLSPLPRYLYSGCCTREDHGPNRLQDGFEEELRKSLMVCRGFYKDFFFTSGIRNVTVLNPGLETPQEDESGLQLWGPDPVHPLPEGYGRIADMICREMEKKASASRKRVGETLEPKNNKRPRFEPARPRWIEQSQPQITVQSGYNNWRGAGGDRGRGRGRGRRPWRGQGIGRGYN